MFSLQKWLSKDDRFFTLMEGSAEEGRASIQSLIQLVKAPPEKRCLDGFIQSRREDKRLTKELTQHLLKTFVTPLEREDIEALANALYKIPKTAEKFSERLLISGKHTAKLELTKHLGMLEQATEIVVLLVKELRKGVNIEKVQAKNDILQKIEGEADKLMVEALRELYEGDHSAVHVVVLKDLYELIEKIFDRCRDVGNIVFYIVLKHS